MVMEDKGISIGRFMGICFGNNFKMVNMGNVKNNSFTNEIHDNKIEIVGI